MHFAVPRDHHADQPMAARIATTMSTTIASPSQTSHLDLMQKRLRPLRRSLAQRAALTRTVVAHHASDERTAASATRKGAWRRRRPFIESLSAALTSLWKLRNGVVVRCDIPSI